MNRLYTVSGIIAIIGFVTGVKVIFSIFSIICIVLIGIGYLIKGYNHDKFIEGAFSEKAIKQKRTVQVISRTITYTIIMGVLYYFFPNIVSWCVDIYCATAIFTAFKNRQKN